METTQKITTNLWFDNQAEEAVNFYVSIFKDSKIGRVSRYGKEGFEIHHMPEGTVMTIEFWLNGQYYTALNGGPIFKFTEAISFIVNCKEQDEVDYYWNKLSEGSDEKAQRCGWLKDKFGLSWQIIPEALPRLLSSKESAKAQKAMHAMMQMKKIDIQKLEQAYNS